MTKQLNDRQKLVLDTIYKQYSPKQALDYLKAQGFEINERTLRRDKNFIKRTSIMRIYEFAKIDFRTLHLERKEKLETIEREMWRNYEKIEDPYKKILAIERIANLQPILSAYEDSTQYVLEKSITNTSEQN